MSEAATGSTAANGGSDPLEWQFLQCFGERTPGEEIQEADIISAVTFDHTGQHLATGDRGGRVVLFERVPTQAKAAGADQRATPASRLSSFEYRYLTEFQSHEPEFDYLKSLEIEEKINKVKWCRTSCGSRMLLSTNDKTIKLWRVGDRKITGVEKIMQARCRRVFGNAHTYHINAISISSDQETFISSDDLRVNLWHLDHTNQSFNVVDIKPPNMEDLTEVITGADFHPSHCNLFAFSSSKGSIRVADMRSSALCDKSARSYEEAQSTGSKSFFSEIISSVSDMKWSSDGRYILARDYMNLKLWDLNMESAPVVTYSLCDLYENDCIFDKFDCAISGNGQYVTTGSYNNFLKVTGRQGGPETIVEASRDPLRKRLQPQAKVSSRFGLNRGASKRLTTPAPAEQDAGNTDFSEKLLHLAWHPEANLIAAAASNSLYMFCAK
ncbi:MAG: PP2A-twin subunit [Trebouxia sp. A1-2]|nr:MAG: PP2A-twin subunit [Trebouxia sp. A1-2]